MKLDETVNLVEIANTPAQTLAFDIKDKAVIAKLLREKIYSNPIRAIVQELAANARDAHREVGTPTLPILIIPPTNLQTTLVVRDYGPGITPERMADIFVNYGTSTKRSSDLQTGGFGLGAKSPFAYSDQFHVHTYIDGIQRVYIAYIDETDIGALSLVSEVPTTEPNGTSVSIPVKKEDIREFLAAIRRAGYYWSPRPKIDGYTEEADVKEFWDKIEDPDIRFTNLLDFVCDFKIQSMYRGNYKIIVIDGVIYPLPDVVVSATIDKYRDLNNYRYMSWMLYAKTGEVPVAATREAIDLKPGVVEFLVEKINTGFTTFINLVHTIAEQKPDTGERLIYLCEVATFLDLEGAIKYQGLTIKELNRALLSITCTSVSRSELNRTSKAIVPKRRHLSFSGVLAEVGGAQGILLLNDLVSDNIPRALLDVVFSQHPAANELILIRRDAAKKVTATQATDAAIKELLSHVSDKTLTSYLGSIAPVIPKAKDTTIRVYKVGQKNQSISSTTVPAEARYFGYRYYATSYISKTRGIGQPVERSYHHLLSILNIRGFYLVTEQNAEKLKKDGWRPVEDLILEKIAQDEFSGLDKLVGDLIVFKQSNLTYLNTDLLLYLQSKTSIAVRLLNRIVEIENNQKAVNDYLLLLGMLNLRYTKTSDGDLVKAMIVEFKKTYPLLEPFAYTTTPPLNNDIVLYINAKDRETETPLADVQLDVLDSINEDTDELPESHSNKPIDYISDGHRDDNSDSGRQKIFDNLVVAR